MDAHVGSGWHQDKVLVMLVRVHVSPGMIARNKAENGARDRPVCQVLVVHTNTITTCHEVEILTPCRLVGRNGGIQAYVELPECQPGDVLAYRRRDGGLVEIEIGGLR